MVMAMVLVVVIVMIMMRVIMLMVMTFVMIVRVAVVMMIMTVVTMIMMAMIVAGADIGTAFGIERRFDLDHAGAEPLHHLLDHVIAADSQVLARDLNRQMPIAEMPGEPHHLPGIDAAKLDQRFRRCDDLNQPAVIEHQGIAAAQRDGLRQIEQEFETTGAGHGHPPPVPVVEPQHDGIGWRIVPAARGPDRRCAQHAQRLTTLAGVMISITVGATFIGPDSSRHAFRCGAWPWASRSGWVSQRSTNTKRFGSATLEWQS
jgi:hypothetical protein